MKTIPIYSSKNGKKTIHNEEAYKSFCEKIDNLEKYNITKEVMEDEGENKGKITVRLTFEEKQPENLIV